MEFESNQISAEPTQTAPDPPSDTARLCPHCRSGLAYGATKCAACGSNVGDIRSCPKCEEPIRSRARVCPYCRSALAPVRRPELEFLKKPWVLEASPLGALILERSPTGLFYPPTLTISETEIHVRRRAFMGLRTMDQKISVERVASVRATSGVIWSAIVIETYGGAAGDLFIHGLDKKEAKATAQVIERIAHLHRRDEGSS